MARQKQILTRADDAIRKAMQHADQAIAQKPYTGPERRGAPRNR